jgi:hypothetical protein
MNRLVALNSAAHRQLRVDQAQLLAQASRLNMLPVVLGEFLKLCVQYPILLTKNGATGQFTCIALFGFEKHENLFWKQDRWDALYVPLQVTRQPFFLGTDQDRVVCIDTMNAAVTRTQGEMIFDEQGAETAYLQQAKQMLAALLDGEERTARFVRKLVGLELIRPMRLDIELANHQKLRVDGLYTIDEASLKALPAGSIAELHGLDYLAPIYTMLASLGQIYSLVQRKNQCFP